MEGLYKNKYRRDPIRLKDWDYAQNGYYYITICTEIRENIFGEVINNKITLNNAGQITQDFWLQIPQHFNNATLDDFIIMPDHIHGIIVLDDERDRLNESVETLHCNVSRTKNEQLKTNPSKLYIRNPSRIKNNPSKPKTQKSLQCNDSTSAFKTHNFYSQISPKPKSISTIIRSFKSICTKTINKLPNLNQKFIWQSGFYDHIIRNEPDYLRIKKYIHLNPLKLHLDRNNPENHNGWMNVKLNNTKINAS